MTLRKVLAALIVTALILGIYGSRHQTAPTDGLSARIYRIAGPQDEARPDVLFDTMKRLGDVTVTPLDLSKSVPEDADLVLIDNPQQDLSDAQSRLLGSYLGRGGALLLITDYIYGAMPGLNAAVQPFGVSAIDGVVFDPASAMGGRPEYPIPQLTEHPIARALSAAGLTALMPLSHAISIQPPDNVSAESLLNTSEQSYLQPNWLEHDTLEQGDLDPSGPFSLAVAAEKPGGKLVWIASADMMTQEADQDVGGANSALLEAAMRWLLGEV